MPRPVSAPMTFGFGLMPTDPNAIAIYKRLGLKGHNGDDYAVYRVPTYSIVPGRVVAAGWVNDGGGYSVRIRFTWTDGREYIAQHDHLSRVDVVVGQMVHVGQQVGITGNSGATAGYHLHFSIRPVSGYNPNDGYYGYVNPAPFYQAQGGAKEMTVFVRPFVNHVIKAKFKKPIMMYNMDTNQPLWESGLSADFVAKTNIVHGSTFYVTQDRWDSDEPFGFKEEHIYAKGNDVVNVSTTPAAPKPEPELTERDRLDIKLGRGFRALVEEVN